MEPHTLVLSATKVAIPEDPTADFVTSLINRGLTQVEYFGIEIDNHCDIISEDMAGVSSEITYIDIHFDSEQAIEYDSLNETEIDQLAVTLLHDNRPEIRADSKDITIYL